MRLPKLKTAMYHNIDVSDDHSSDGGAIHFPTSHPFPTESNLLTHIAPLIIIYRDRCTAAGRASKFTAVLAKQPYILGANPLELSVKLDFLEKELGVSCIDVPVACWRDPKIIYVKAKILR